MTQHRSVYSFREIPDSEWQDGPPDHTIGDRIYNLFCSEDQSELRKNDGRCWHTIEKDFSPCYRGCHSALGSPSVKNKPFLFNGFMRIDKNADYRPAVNSYAEYMSSYANPAWRESLQAAYICRNPKTEEIIGWVWPDLSKTPAYQTTHFCISTRDLTEHAGSLINYIKYYESKDYANGDQRLARMLCWYFLENRKELNRYGGYHWAFAPDEDGRIPLPYLNGPEESTKDLNNKWILTVNKYYEVFDKTKNKTMTEFINRYKELTATATAPATK